MLDAVTTVAFTILGMAAVLLVMAIVAMVLIATLKTKLPRNATRRDPEVESDHLSNPDELPITAKEPTVGESNPPPSGSFYAKRVMTEPEQILFHRLCQSQPYHVFPQVAFSQFIGAKGRTRKERFTHFAHARQKVADFVLCRHDSSIVAVIELDDSSHDQKRDHAKDRILNDAGLTVIRWHVRDIPDSNAIRTTIRNAISSPAQDAAVDMSI
ncbi:hypothetical protein KBTX_02700 [wastewater metagenome]|uniref:DUF2726 domain-containing protein n=2 Tax=unclassified sequences TaxID=12908 RepID=A0A5B8RET9_9ZZZZ|nr:DUF2726 domain-containing protein [Arhodomonas sp. KWT]QEA06368.1 hypothetical protein KBTEX_02700 [uncultured organism]